MKIPELELLSDGDWLTAIRDNKLKTDADFREALNAVRCTSKFHFADILRSALQDYASANDGELPGDLIRLTPYFHPPVNDALIQRYALKKTGKLNDVSLEEILVAETAQPVDDTVDTLFEIRREVTNTTGTRRK